MNPASHRKPTNPAVVIPAQLARHMIASFVLFDKCLATRALMSAAYHCPQFLLLMLFFFASTPFMPWCLTGIAKIFEALRALCFLLTFFALYDCLATDLRAKSLVLRVCNLLINQ